MTNRRTISVSYEVYKRIIQLKQELHVNSIDLVLRWLLKMPPFEQSSYTSSIKSEQKKSTKSINHAQSRYTSNISRAKRYRDKIIEEQGYITEDQLKRIADKFGVSIEEIWDDLIMKEPGKYYPI